MDPSFFLVRPCFLSKCEREFDRDEDGDRFAEARARREAPLFGGLDRFGIKSEGLIKYFIFFLGLTFILHLVFSAKTIQAKKGDFLKANYIFGFSFVYILNIILLSFGLNIIFKEFSFVNFFNNSFLAAKNILYAVFKQLFLR